MRRRVDTIARKSTVERITENRYRKARSIREVQRNEEDERNGKKAQRRTLGPRECLSEPITRAFRVIYRLLAF